MNKVDRWNKIWDDYFRTVSKEQLIQDSMRAGIVLVPIQKIRLKRGTTLGRVKKMSKGLFQGL